MNKRVFEGEVTCGDRWGWTRAPGGYEFVGWAGLGSRIRITVELVEKTAGEVAHAAVGHMPWLELSQASRDEYETIAKAVLDWDAERRRKAVKDI